MTTHLTTNRALGLAAPLFDPETLDLVPFAWPGGYAVSFVDREGSEICYRCAAQQIEERLSDLVSERAESGDRSIPEMLRATDPADLVAMVHAGERDSCSVCDVCSEEIRSAYCSEEDPSPYCDLHSSEALAQEPESDPSEDLLSDLRSWLSRVGEDRGSWYYAEGERGLSLRRRGETEPRVWLALDPSGALDLSGSWALAWDSTPQSPERIGLAGNAALGREREPSEIRAFVLSAMTRQDPLRWAPIGARSLGWDLLRVAGRLDRWEGSADSGDLWGWALAVSWDCCEMLAYRGRSDLIPESLGYRPSAAGPISESEEESAGARSLAVYRSETLGSVLSALAPLLDRIERAGLSY